MPIENVDLASIGPLFCARYVTVTHRIIFDVFPFFGIRFAAPKLAIPIFRLPDWNLIAVWPRACDVIPPKRNPLFQPLRRKSMRRAKQMNMIRENDIATDAPERGCTPRFEKQ